MFYVNPMSYSNLSVYDFSLLSHLKVDGHYFCSKRYDQGELKRFSINKIYKYNDLPQPLKTLSYVLSQLRLVYYDIILKPEVIHIQWIKFYYYDYFIYLIIKLITPSVQIVHTVHNVLPHDSGEKYNYIFKKYYKLVDKLIVHHESTGKELCKRYSIDDNKIAIINHGIIDDNGLYSTDNDDVLCQELTINKGKYIFGFLGSISKYKGIDLLVDTIIEYKTNLIDINVEIIIAGLGYLPRIEELQKTSNVTIINRHLSDHEISFLYRKCDCIVLPYTRISQSGVLFTAIAMNTPVIVTNCGGLTEPFDHGNIGQILSEQTIEELYQKIVLVVESLREGGFLNHEFQKVKAIYSWGKISNTTAELYSSLISKVH
jgi:D-inositol-3-phosphate glycosyltransferase